MIAMAQILVDRFLFHARWQYQMAQSSEDETTSRKRGWGEQEKINPMVPGHRALYKKAGITKLQIQVGRTKLNRQTPEQEHKARADGISVTQKRKPDELVLDEKK